MFIAMQLILSESCDTDTTIYRLDLSVHCALKQHSHSFFNEVNSPTPYYSREMFLQGCLCPFGPIVVRVHLNLAKGVDTFRFRHPVESHSSAPLPKPPPSL